MLENHGRIGFTEVHVGLPLPIPIVEKLKFSLNSSLFNDMILLGKTLKGKEALANGLIHFTAENNNSLRKLVLTKMKEILLISPEAFAWTKYNINQSILENYEGNMKFIFSKLKNETFIENLLSKIQSFLDHKK